MTPEELRDGNAELCTERDINNWVVEVKTLRTYITVTSYILNKKEAEEERFEIGLYNVNSSFTILE